MSNLTNQVNGVKTFFFFLISFFLLFHFLQTASLPNPKHFSSKPLMTLLFQTHPPSPKKKKKRRGKEYLISLSYISVSFLLFWSMILSLSLSLSLSLCGQNNERGYDDGFVDVKSVEVSGLAKKSIFLVWNPVDLNFIFWSFMFGYWENEGEGSIFWFETQ